MRDRPDADALLGIVAETLRTTIIPELSGAAAYQARIAANLLEVIRREYARGDADDAAELASLQALLGREGDLKTLNAALAEALRAGALDCAAPSVADHLRSVTRAKLAVDQPKWPREIT